MYILTAQLVILSQSVALSPDHLYTSSHVYRYDILLYHTVDVSCIVCVVIPVSCYISRSSHQSKLTRVVVHSGWFR